MGDYFHSYVSMEPELDDADARAERLIGWLLAERWILPGLGDAGLGSPAYRPGPAIPSVLELSPESSLMTMATNGLTIHTERTVFDAGEFGFSAACSLCSGKIGDGDALELVGRWYAQEPDVTLSCDHCRGEQTLLDLALDPPWGFSNFGIRTWNWPVIPTERLREVESVVDMRLKHIAGKL